MLAQDRNTFRFALQDWLLRRRCARAFEESRKNRQNSGAIGFRKKPKEKMLRISRICQKSGCVSSHFALAT